MLDYRGDQRFVNGLGDWSDRLRTGRVQEGRDLPTAEQIPPRLRPMSRRWGYLDDGIPTDDEMTDEAVSG